MNSDCVVDICMLLIVSDVDLPVGMMDGDHHDYEHGTQARDLHALDDAGG